MMAVWLAGCGTPQINRIDQNREVYESWPIETKQAVLDGKIEVGMTPEMVRVAWGQPTEVISRSTGPGDEEIWIYRKGGNEDYSMGGPGGVYGGGYPGTMGGGNTVGIGVATGRGMGTVVGPVVGGGMGGMGGMGGGLGGMGGIGGMGGVGGMGTPVMTSPSRVEEKEVVFRSGVVYRADSP